MSGMKEGADIDPFEEDEKAEDTPTNKSDPDQTDTDTTDESMSSDQQLRQEPALPYIYSRENAEEGRDQKPIWLQPDTQEQIPDRIDELSQRLDDDILKTDYLEAVILADTESKTVESVLRDWGYGRS